VAGVFLAHAGRYQAANLREPRLTAVGALLENLFHRVVEDLLSSDVRSFAVTTTG